MESYPLNKIFSYDSPHNVRLLLEYIEAPIQRRVFQGNYEGFNALQLLHMLGFNTDYVEKENGKLSPRICMLHAYKSEASELLALAEELE